MNFRLLQLLFFTLLLLTTQLSAIFNLLGGPYQVYTGPEVYHVLRERNHGQQAGLLVGEHTGFEHIVPNTLYLGLDGYYATGTLRGTDRNHLDLNSTLTESEVEGRAGFTMHTRYCPFLLLVPYLGYGHFYSKNQIQDPYPFPFTFQDDFAYLSAGFKTRIILSHGFTMGIDFKIKVPFKSNSIVRGDPLHPNMSLIMGLEEQYEAEIPLQFNLSEGRFPVGLEIVPFYRYRHFGEHEDQFNFFDTQFHCVGVRAVVFLLF